MSFPLVMQKFSEQGFSMSAKAQIEMIVEIVELIAVTISSALEESEGIKSKNRANICSESVLPFIM